MSAHRDYEVKVLKRITIYSYKLLYTSFNPQNLRNIIKKVAKIRITQIIIELACQNYCILLFF